MDDLINKLTIDDENLWFGFYSIKSNWVILDRELSVNQNSKTLLLFTKCDDWTSYEENFTNWEEPNYIYFLKFIQNLESEKKEKILRDLNDKKEEYLKSIRQQKKLEEIEKKRDKIKSIHNEYLKNKRLPSASVIRTNKNRRITFCWNCRTDLDNEIDFECERCKWIVCSICGACRKNNCIISSEKI